MTFSNALLFSQKGLDFPLPQRVNLDAGKTHTMENSSYVDDNLLMMVIGSNYEAAMMVTGSNYEAVELVGVGSRSQRSN